MTPQGHNFIHSYKHFSLLLAAVLVGPRWRIWLLGEACRSGDFFCQTSVDHQKTREVESTAWLAPLAEFQLRKKEKQMVVPSSMIGQSIIHSFIQSFSAWRYLCEFLSNAPNSLNRVNRQTDSVSPSYFHLSIYRTISFVLFYSHSNLSFLFLLLLLPYKCHPIFLPFIQPTVSYISLLDRFLCSRSRLVSPFLFGISSLSLDIFYFNFCSAHSYS